MSRGKNKQSLVKTIKKIARQQEIERNRLVGKPRAKTFGGKAGPKSERKMAKNRLRKLDEDTE